MILPPGPSAAPSLAADVLARLPLAEVFYRIRQHLAADDALQPIFDRHRGQSYQQKLSFADIVRVLADALTRFHGRGRPAIDNAITRQRLDTRQRAVHAKLSRIPSALAEALRAQLTGRVRPLLPSALPRVSRGCRGRKCWSVWARVW